VIHANGTFTQNCTLAIGGDGGIVLEGLFVAGFGQFKSIGGNGAFTLCGADRGADLPGGSIGLGVHVHSSAASSTIDGSGMFAQNMVTNFCTILIASGQTLAMVGQILNSEVFVGSTTEPAGSIELRSSAHLLVTGSTPDLQGFGGQVLLDDASDTIDGAAGTTLVSDGNTITGAGDVGSGQLAFSNFSFFSLVNATGALTIDTGTNTITNASKRQASAGGSLTLTGSVDNSSSIEAIGGTVVLQGAVTDTGQIGINGGRVDVLGGVASGQTLTLQTASARPRHCRSRNRTRWPAPSKACSGSTPSICRT
jgi:hypothetical protein